MTFPPALTTDHLSAIAHKACEDTLSSSEGYVHASVNDWNAAIINQILQAVIAKTSTDGNPPPYKYIVNSTIIQHIGSSPEGTTGGRRGMHSAVGAYWNNEKDGTWTYKWKDAEKKGMDIVISLTWVGV
ncbi:Tctex-1 [Clohesyomyces aquaticus]|uniref:Tctex-1 n=1 Tax=Clohesyomyces aquaticus TaxID=1231657 RepID=A0A1Y1YLS2_9PLEO|nr:Tctex-1 [Clohesyomyces aquaticus]